MTEKLEIRLLKEEKVLKFPQKKEAKAIDIIPNILRQIKDYSYNELEDFVQKFVEAYNEMMQEKSIEFLDEGLDI
jgi:tRNA A-37 threonylcarbamoyl transferase component Bud32